MSAPTEGDATVRATPIVALDVGSADEAMAMARQLGDRCRFYKVGSELFTAAGPDVVRALQSETGADVFLDLKLHDIPTTVAGAVQSAVKLGVRLLTLHVSGGEAMLAAASAAAGDQCGLLGVTVLTSLDGPSLGVAWGRSDLDVSEEVLRLAGIAASAGLHGIVCSGAEGPAVSAVHGKRLAMLVPGIRLAGGEHHDQRRVMTPAAAQAAGARYVILGRMVTAAQSPRVVMERVLAELGGAAEGGG